ncbi:TRIM56 [Mytilus edulis]|uniref:TRIM56 n=1 Tax=Mytilus edulis TaxID=6550 RepID=A0A8S3QXZ6_MYTED|nr:TRIM56 [Mytilus edulis]
MHFYVHSFVRYKGKRQKWVLQEHPDNPETLARQLPINHLMTSMMDLKDITRSEKMCNACQLSSVLKKAVSSWCTVFGEAYCTECTKDYRKFRMSYNHKIISIEELKSSEGVFGKSGIVFCDEHPDKAIVFCEDHSKPCCTLCATINHRKCESVTSVDKATAGIKQQQKPGIFIGNNSNSIRN